MTDQTTTPAPAKADPKPATDPRVDVHEDAIQDHEIRLSELEKHDVGKLWSVVGRLLSHLSNGAPNTHNVAASLEEELKA